MARKIMEYLDQDANKKFSASDLMHQADKELDAGITGFMAGAIASMVATVHSRGEEFRASWNKGYGVEAKGKGVVNPAIVTISDKK